MGDMRDLSTLRMHFLSSHPDDAAGQTPPFDSARSGKEPAVLLHGWPQTSSCWRELMPLLTADRRVIAPDLRGYGLTGKPTRGYDKRQMAADVIELLDALEIERVHLVGHDRGGRVAHRLALDAPHRVSTLTVLDIAPTHAMFSADMQAADGYFHWLFHMQPDLPELLTAGREAEYLRYFFQRWTFRRDLLAPKIPEYIEAFTQPGAMRSGFDDYRASWQDIADDEEDLRAGRRLTVPTLALWGAQGLASGLDILDLWRPYITEADRAEAEAASAEPDRGQRGAAPRLLRGRAVESCGHFIPEEQPDLLADELKSFWETAH
ncbi:alpha/beta fold hydrolase [Nesterenkonia aerolata]|uniref:Alpha/beta hydrolase n=1 Tax=Nesterenkonia aerolata TaxID=3074079 RepID=A0ABU2DUW3_9MICC|nr:alpha/beta hydrolase [Nesterenkonia sp. LY-0111]MDR8020302.1 alpha/beta hydrolase [Nesterenkonia sp. LY-0111]